MGEIAGVSERDVESVVNETITKGYRAGGLAGEFWRETDRDLDPETANKLLAEEVSHPRGGPLQRFLEFVGLKRNPGRLLREVNPMTGEIIKDNHE
jgi:hypothetical protein